MGKEAKAWGQLSDGESDGKLLWEPPKLIFRGAVRGIYQGHALRGIRVEGDDIVLSDGTRFTLDPGQADKWVHAILNPPSRLDKLGVKPGMTVVVDGVDDEAFLEELAGRVEAEQGTAEDFEEVDLLFLAADDLAELDRLEDLKGVLADKGAIWIVSQKGKGAPLKDTDVLGAARGVGLSDTKVCGFSATHTALRFVVRKG
ncbi:DUF3052 domain-containing protein [Caulobacter sp. D4A]|uniref:DUF3052 family protein n=1 Tax=unclassified Caulobacter TaxID=2648921 RepID=UPI000D73668F|nr:MULTISPECIES: DUF3052 family protein [unclassified Caulobacter]PXA78940.1 DUF3052 domain-containing protein [Caulobacter sp. D4A]PXA95956.1 DUF3052 domain-containing protein [Caulobacter sp. D5]